MNKSCKCLQLKLNYAKVEIINEKFSHHKMN